MRDLIFRKADISDAKLYFKWLNDSEVRKSSFNSEFITWNEHIKWFSDKVVDPNYNFYLFQIDENNIVGQVRFQKLDDSNSIIGVSVSQEHRGFGYGAKMIVIACKDYLKYNKNQDINAYIKKDNISSKIIFEKAGFLYFKDLIYNNFNSFHYKYYADRKFQYK